MWNEETRNKLRNNVIFEVMKSVTMKNAVLWDSTPCNLQIPDGTALTYGRQQVPPVHWQISGRLQAIIRQKA